MSQTGLGKIVFGSEFLLFFKVVMVTITTVWLEDPPYVLNLNWAVWRELETNKVRCCVCGSIMTL